MSDTAQDTLTEVEQEQWQELMQKPESELTDAEKTSKIKLSVKRRYDPPEWSLCFELSSPEGRRADAIAVNTFPSRNFKVVGFEFKASRSDWLAEKREAAKADYFVTAVDEWYVVAWDGIVNEEELPNGWGLLELKPNSEQLWTQVESELTEHQQGDPDRAFWGRFIQKAVGGESNFSQQDLVEARRRGYEEGKEEGGETYEQRRIENKAEKWDELKEAGLDLNMVSDKKIRELQAARDLIQQFDEDGFRSVRSEFDDLINAINQARAPLERLERQIGTDNGDGDAE